MALLRIIHAATLPDPGELARQLQSGATIASVAPTAREAPAQGDPVAQAGSPATFAALIDMLDRVRQFGLAEKLRIAGRVIRYAPPEIVLSAAKPIPAELPRDLADALKSLTGTSWRVTTEDAPGAASIREAEAGAREQELAAVRGSPVVAAALEIFPDAEITGWDMHQRSEAL
jgi:DNA polymerase-3 subunit gamma/tau